MEVQVGQKASRSMTLTAQHVQTFAEITGDYNPLHLTKPSPRARASGG